MDVLTKGMTLENRIKGITDILERVRENTTSREWKYYVTRPGELEQRIYNDRMTGDLVEALGTCKALLGKMSREEMFSIARRDR